MIRRGRRVLALAVTTAVVGLTGGTGLAVLTPSAASAAGPACPAPGADGAPSASLTGVVNTYYPLTASAPAGSSSLSVGSPTGASDRIAAGDELLVVQIQGAGLSTSNSDDYGSGTGTGRGAISVTAGTYEYVEATAPVASDGTVPISGSGTDAGLLSDYTVGAGSTVEVIRVPQYASATLSSGLTALPWTVNADGTGGTGGVLALDVAGTLTLASATVSLEGLGFRGGASRAGTGSAAAGSTDYVAPSAEQVDGEKGEGLAGTPGGSTDGYPGGDYARGAPGNAGGGGTDGDPAANDDNSGGGAGGNGGVGGTGGNTSASDQALGGLGGDAFSADAGHAVLGGGGGAGSLGAGAAGPASGGTGGGLALLRVGGLSGDGTLSVDGEGAPADPADGAAGGGGAGGSAIVTAPAGVDLSGLTVTADGGAGGDADLAGNETYGPGGGGGGGAVLASAALAGGSSAAGGAGGSTTSVGSYGAQAGSDGLISATAAAASVPGVYQGAQCSAVLAGQVFDDANASGAPDTGESAVGTGGQVVTLTDTTTGAVIATADAGGTGGAYRFPVVPTGVPLTVSTPAIAGRTASTPLSYDLTIPVGATSYADQDFGFYTPGEITGTVYDDGNGDAQQDNLEMSRSGVTVTVTPHGGTVATASLTPSADGSFSAGGLAPGTYDVTISGPGASGALVTQGSLTDTVTVGEVGPSTPDIVGLATPANLTVQVYEDANADGRQDNGEVADPSAAVTLTGPAAFGVPTALTLDASGATTLTGIAPGAYSVAVTGTADQVQTQAVASAVISGTAPGLIQLGYYNQHQIDGTVFGDLNGDGLQNGTGAAAETGLVGVTVDLLDAGGAVVSTTTTVGAADGTASYSFATQPPGTYSVRVDELRGGYVITTGNGTQAVTLTDGADVTVEPVGEQQRAGSLTGLLYDDATGSGSPTGKPLVTGSATVTVTDPFGNVQILHPTGGSWSLSGLPAGDYQVTASVPGYVATTTQPAVVAVAEAASPVEVDFGLARPVTISGQVYDDADGSTRYSTGESGRSGVTITVTDTTTGAVVSATGLAPAAADGSYSVTGLPPGAYTVTLSGPGTTGNVAVTQGALVTTLGSLTEGTIQTVDVGLADLVGLDVTIYDDANANGAQDQGEGVDQVAAATLSGPAAFADQGKALALDPSTGTATELVPPGSYTVTVTGTSGQTPTQTSPTTVTLTEGQPSDAAVILGYFTPGGLSGVIYDDANGNSVRDAGEGPPAGVTGMAISNAAGTPPYAQTAVVDQATGAWTVASVPPGTYHLTVVGLPAGLLQTQASQGTQASGVTVTVAENSVTTDAEGFVAPATLSGTVYDDANADGAREVGEGAFAGATVTVADVTRGGSARAVPVTAGSWSLAGLLPGSYRVTIAGVGGAVQTQDTVGSPVTVAEGAGVTLANGFYSPATLSGTVFEDSNGDGLLSPGEVGLDNRTVSIVRVSTDPVTGAASSVAAGTAVTSNGGRWSIPGLPAGTYTATTTAPTGVVRTTPDQTVTVAEGKTVTGINLGTQEKDASVSGTVFSDDNGDGVRGTGEGGIPDVSVVVTSTASGTVVGSTTTGASGQWSVTGLQAGSYSITVATPAASTLTTQSQAGGADPATVTLVAGRAAAPLLVGFRGADAPPVFSATTNNTAQTLNSGDSPARLTATDANSDPLTFALTSGALPTGVRVNPNGTFAGTVVNTTNVTIAYPPVTITVSDGHGGTATTSLQITVLPAADTAPIAAPDTVHTTPGTPASVSVLGNDSDTNGDQLTLVSFTQGSRGSAVACTAAGACTIHPAATVINGTETFTYVVSDGRGGTDQGTVTVVLDNVKPLFTSAPANTAQSVPTGGQLLAVSATDGNGDAVTYSLDPDSTLPPGVTSLTSSGAFLGSPTTVGTYVLEISADDGRTGGGPAATTQLTVTVTEPSPVVDNKPVAVADTFPLAGGPPITPGTPVTLDVLANDTDADSDPLTIVAFDTPTIGGSVIEPSDAKELIYTPRPGFVGTDQFTYTVSDGRGGTDVGKVSVTVSAPEDQPPYFTALPANTTQVVASGVHLVPLSAADPDTPSDKLVYSVVSGSLPVGVSLDPATGAFTGAPTNAGTTDDSYVVTVQVSDGTLTNTPPQVLTITVTPQPRVDHPPVAVDDTASTPSGRQVTIDVLANDSDPDGDALTLTGPSSSADGGTVVCAQATGCTYTPAPGFSGDDSFVYTVSDGTLTANATVTVTVAAAPTPSVVADDDTATTSVGTSVVIPVVLNDTDSDQLPLTATANSQPAHGAVTCGAGTCTYTPNPGFTGNDTFTYVATDDRGGSGMATVTVAVVVPAAPTVVAGPDTATTANGTPVTISVTANDLDSLGLPLSVVPATPPVHGTATCANGSCTYAPDAGWTGGDTFTYAVTDGEGGSSIGTVTVTVLPPKIKTGTVVAPVVVGGAITVTIGVGSRPNTPVGGRVLKVSGHLAPGLHLSRAGLFTGSATTAGSFTASVVISVEGVRVQRKVILNVLAGTGLPQTTTPPTGSTQGAGTGAGDGSGGTAVLPFTGADGVGAALTTGIGLLYAGLCLLALGRRRRRTLSSA